MSWVKPTASYVWRNCVLPPEGGIKNEENGTPAEIAFTKNTATPKPGPSGTKMALTKHPGTGTG
ncbi:hypothetical protein GCM10011571_19950 [Marinithermofilum abyssi]|uniref:Uncharacterized protein n=1 Tax=Marinithermofilum abyssi TaxID=1571185 RepID=A0A8J2YAQ5_9BACL|nr:hypothetical protein GCM10011571_19950 [Marinithermofilum abyssi]